MTLPSSRIVSTLSGLRTSSLLREPIGHTPVSGDFPGHHAVVEPRNPVVPIERLFPPVGDLLAHRLPLPDLVDAARHDSGFGSIPPPLVGESHVRHALRNVLEFRLVPLLAAIGGHFHGLDGATTGPVKPADL